MGRRKKYTIQYPADWEVTTELVVNGRHVTPGTEVHLHPVHGRYVFVKQVKTPTATWLDFIGPVQPGHVVTWESADGRPARSRAQWRSFGPGCIKTVHATSVLTKGKVSK